MFKRIFKEHLDYLYQGINLVRYKEFPFYTKIERQWGLLELGNQIKNKIEYLEDDLSVNKIVYPITIKRD